MALCLARDPALFEKDLTEHFVSGEQVFDGNLLKVHRDTVRLPDGSQGEREYIRHPGAVAIVALTDDGTVLLERQFRYPLRREFIEMPAGKIEPRRGAPRDRQARAAGGDRLRGRRVDPPGRAPHRDRLHRRGDRALPRAQADAASSASSTRANSSRFSCCRSTTRSTWCATAASAT